MYLVLIETSGNQEYIFATNKLSENVGASELITQVGTDYVWEAVRNVGGKQPHDPHDPTTYPVLGNGNPVEVITATSGKALLLANDAEIARTIVWSVTRKALNKAPGLQVFGVVSRSFDFYREPLHGLMGEVYRSYEQKRSSLAGPSTRFLKLPIIADCASSGLPASYVAGQGPFSLKDQGKCFSAESFAKRSAGRDWERRIAVVLNQHGIHKDVPDTTTELEDLECDWFAIVHADGNGLGHVFLSFDKQARVTDNRDYITKLRSFSLAIDQCAKAAFCEALNTLRPKNNRLPVVPLVLGGDDLTMICDGRQALRFTKEFVDGFENKSAQHPAIQLIASLNNGITCSAGVAIIKPHFPFFAGYQLASELISEAKKLAKKDPNQFVSAIDFHVLYNASVTDLKRIRRELTVDNGKTFLFGRPYVVTDNQVPVSHVLQQRRWSQLKSRVDAVRMKDVDGRRALPNSMLHELREALFLGREEADAQLHLVLERYRHQGLNRLLGDPSNRGSLFWQECGVYRTALIDTLDAAEFWEP